MKIIFMIITLNDLIFLGAGIFMLFAAFSTFAAKLRIQNTPTSKIRSISMGPVEIYGELSLLREVC